MPKSALVLPLNQMNTSLGHPAGATLTEMVLSEATSLAMLNKSDFFYFSSGDGTFHYFFSVSPQVTVYLLIDAPFDNIPYDRHEFPHFLDNNAPLPPVIDHDVESPIDVYQRNALLLQTFPRFLFFVSARSMIRTVTYYNERRWIPENLDYNKLLRGCREESVTHMLLVRAKVEVMDLTDDVTKIGDYPVSYGSFADVWKAVWTDRNVWTDRSDRHCKGQKLVSAPV